MGRREPEGKSRKAKREMAGFAREIDQALRREETIRDDEIEREH